VFEVKFFENGMPLASSGHSRVDRKSCQPARARPFRPVLPPDSSF